jgi:Rps23 Pro-64 3,4-dihydroxylase Tpa1-like proline 4-hydroxylase
MASLLNPNLNLEALKKEFQTSRLVVIDQVLKPEAAEEIHQFMQNMPDDCPKPWWLWARWNEDSGAKLTYTQPVLQLQAEEDRKLARIRRNQGQYSYAFKRTSDDHFAKCNCRLCQYRQWLAGPEFMNLLTEITGRKYDLINMFANKYQAGDYLDRHTDKVNNRDLTYVFNFTKGWRA